MFPFDHHVVLAVRMTFWDRQDRWVLLVGVMHPDLVKHLGRRLV